MSTLKRRLVVYSAKKSYNRVCSGFIHFRVIMYEVKLSTVEVIDNKFNLKYCCVMCYHWYVLHIQDGTTPLFLACQNTQIPVVNQLIEAKANVNIPRVVSTYYIQHAHTKNKVLYVNIAFELVNFENGHLVCEQCGQEYQEHKISSNIKYNMNTAEFTQHYNTATNSKNQHILGPEVVYRARPILSLAGSWGRRARELV